MKKKQVVILIILILVGASALFMSYDTGANLDYVLSRRAIRLATMLVVGISVAYSSLIFQTITNNKILTPSMMGYESIFILFQTVIVFLYGDKTFTVISQEINFFFAVILMMLFSVFIYVLIFGKEKKNIFNLLLLGMVLGTLFHTMSHFMQVIIDPNQFSIVQSFMFVSFSKMNTKLLLIASIVLLASLIYVHRYLRYLDVIALGREHAINLGIDYNGLIRKFLLVIALLVSVSTALVGPITFLGILVTNLTYEVYHTYRHRQMVWVCSAIACVFLVLGQFFVEHVFSFSTTVSIIINFIGGVYFLYLILKTQKRL